MKSKVGSLRISTKVTNIQIDGLRKKRKLKLLKPGKWGHYQFYENAKEYKSIL